MTRPGKTWTSYSRLIGAISQRYGGPLHVVLSDDAQLQEEQWTAQLSTELRPRHPNRQEVQELLAGLDIGGSQFRCHLKSIARWGRERRRLLREGGNFQLLEGLRANDDRLKGLCLSGKVHEQRRQLAQHLNTDEMKFEGQGWLPPVASQGRKFRVFDKRQVVWLYSASEVDFHEGLHGFVARSLIAKYLPEPGVVVDPMAGSGVVAQMATQMGHWAWASDIAPQREYIAHLDLLESDLGEVIADRYERGAELVVIHPPLPATLKMNTKEYETWLGSILEHCWGAVKAGGHLVLIVPLATEFYVLQMAQTALLESAAYGLNVDVHELTAIHTAATTNGEVGWHLLVLQSPPFVPEETSK